MAIPIISTKGLNRNGSSSKTVRRDGKIARSRFLAQDAWGREQRQRVRVVETFKYILRHND